MANLKAVQSKTSSERDKGRVKIDSGDEVGTEAADLVASRGQTAITLPIFGKLLLPSSGHLAWYLGVGVLVAAEVVEWPVALILVVGKALSDNHSSSSLREFGQALDEVA